MRESSHRLPLACSPLLLRCPMRLSVTAAGLWKRSGTTNTRSGV